jgi:hypothetical protein
MGNTVHTDGRIVGIARFDLDVATLARDEGRSALAPMPFTEALFRARQPGDRRFPPGRDGGGDEGARRVRPSLEVVRVVSAG